MKNFKEKERDIIKKFKILDNWEERYEYLIFLASEMPKMDNKYKTKNKLISGCQSKVWLHAYLNNYNQIMLSADSDAILSKGIIALILKIYSNSYVEEVIKSKAIFISEIGFEEFLSINRSNGMLNIIKKIKIYAITLFLNKKS